MFCISELATYCVFPKIIDALDELSCSMESSSHDFAGNFIAQEFLPEEIKGCTFFQAGSSSKEQAIEKNQNKLWSNKYNK